LLSDGPAARRVAAILGGGPTEAQSRSSVNFGRMFPSLPPFAQNSQASRAALTDMGKPGGLLDAKDNLAAGPVALITDAALNVDNPNNTTHTRGNDVPRPVPRPRHHLRRRFAAGGAH